MSLPRSVDLAIVGGGLYGAWTACLAARAGLRVLLVERDDWGSGTSCASSKLIHGGLRYLEYYDFGLVRKALRERRVLSRLAPHLVWPLRFVAPMWRDHRVPPWKMGLGLTLYDLLAGKHQPVHRHRGHAAADLRGAYPWLRPDDLRHAFSYGDCGTDDARLVWAVVESAIEAGADCRGRVEALGILVREGEARGLHLRDRVSGEEGEVAAAVALYTTGAWPAKVPQAPRLRMTKGVHLVLPALPSAALDLPDRLPDGRHAWLLTSPVDGRVFFLVPWYGRTLLGTTDTPYTGDPGAVAVDAADRAYLLASVASRCPGLAWTEADVLGEWAGVRALRDVAVEDPGAVSRDWELVEPMPGLGVSVGGKLTSARVEAERLVRWAAGRLERPLPPTALWAEAPLLSARDHREALGEAGLDADVRDSLVRRHGSHAPAVLRLCRELDAMERIDPDLPFLLGECAWAIRHEQARSEEDVFRRRVPVALLGRVPDDVHAKTRAWLGG